MRHYGHAGAQAQIGHGVDVGIGDIGAVVEASAAADPGRKGIAFEADDDRTVLPIPAAGDATNTPLESIDVLDCEKSKLAAAPPKVPPIHQPAKRFGDTGGGASERSGGGPSLMTSALRTGLETAALAVNAAAKARA